MVEKFGASSEEGTLIKSTVEKATEVTKDDAKTIQNKKNVWMKLPSAASDRGLEALIDIKK